jgi:integrase/recombinase XerD
MPARTEPSPRATLRNPRASGTLGAAAPLSVVDARGRHERATARSLYASHLRVTTSSFGDSYSPHTIESYLAAVDNLDEWATRRGVTGGFDALDVDDLNHYFTGYRKTHSQGGTNTLQRRLRVFFGWLGGYLLEPSAGWTDPMGSAKLARYAPGAPAATAYAEGFLDELLATCTGDDLEALRDRAILRLLGTGIRRGELDGIFVEDLDLAERLVQIAALKGSRRHAPALRRDRGREMRAGRLIPIGDATVLALHRYLRTRAAHKLVRDPGAGPLWYATRGRGRLTGNGIWRMVRRRAELAGYDPSLVNVHAFRHTRAHTLMANEAVNEGDVMQLMGWRDRTMLDRYAANLAQQRAVGAARRAGLVD